MGPYAESTILDIALHVFDEVVHHGAEVGLCATCRCWACRGGRRGGRTPGILMVCHQLAVALRERPRTHSGLTWPDRAWLALLAGTLPAGRLAAMRLIVTPATILRWHRDIARRRWARLPRRGRSGRPPVRRIVGR